MARAACSSAPLSGAANFIQTYRLGWLIEKPPFLFFLVLSLVITVFSMGFKINSIAYDNVVESSIPETWTLKVVFL
jgi:hypothetical protein